jgi:DNA-binding transcriptional ArsR family regulator
VFAALGDDTRLRLVTRLCRKGPSSITGLTEGSGVSRQAVTKHLHVLEEAGLVRSERVGRETRWRIRPEGLETAHERLDRISAAWDEALSRLKDFVE